MRETRERGQATELSRIGNRSSRISAVAWALTGIAVVGLAMAGRVPSAAPPAGPDGDRTAHASAGEATPRRFISTSPHPVLPSLDGRLRLAAGLTIRSPQPGSAILGDGLLRIDLTTDRPPLGQVAAELRSGPGILVRKELEPTTLGRAAAWLRVPLVREARAVDLTLHHEATGHAVGEMQLLQLEELPVVITSPVLPDEHLPGSRLRVQGRARDGGDISVRIERADGSAIASAVVPSIFDGTRYPYTSVFWVSFKLPPEALGRPVWIRAEPSSRGPTASGLRIPVVLDEEIPSP